MHFCHYRARDNHHREFFPRFLEVLSQGLPWCRGSNPRQEWVWPRCSSGYLCCHCTGSLLSCQLSDERRRPGSPAVLLPALDTIEAPIQPRLIPAHHSTQLHPGTLCRDPNTRALPAPVCISSHPHTHLLTTVHPLTHYRVFAQPHIFTLILKSFIYLYLCGCVCTYSSACAPQASRYLRRLKGAMNPLELVLQTQCECWEANTSVREANDLNY